MNHTGQGLIKLSTDSLTKLLAMFIFLIVLLVLSAFAFYWFFKTIFQRDIKSPGLSLAETAVIGNKVIGLDNKNKTLIWTSEQDNHTFKKKHYPFAKILSIAVVHEMDTLTQCTSKVILQLYLYGREAPQCFSFYDAAIDPVVELPHRVRKAGYWKKKIQVQLNAIKAGQQLEYVL